MSIDKSQQAAEILLKRQEAYDTLLGFTEFTFPQFATAEHHRLICEKLQQIESGEINRLMIFMPPRHGKVSWLAGVFRHGSWVAIPIHLLYTLHTVRN